MEKKKERSQTDLETTIKEKVAPLVEETMSKTWGITIPKIESDITDQLTKPALHLYIPLNLPYKDAKKKFKKEFLTRELRRHIGNVSELAKILGIDRRSIHRTIKELDIDMDTMRKRLELDDHKLEHFVDNTIRSTLDQYKTIIHPEKMEQLYSALPKLSRNIAQLLPQEILNWKDAEDEFEKQFISHSLNIHHHNISQTARDLGLRAETLYRKIRELSIR